MVRGVGDHHDTRCLDGTPAGFSEVSVEVLLAVTRHEPDETDLQGDGATWCHVHLFTKISAQVDDVLHPLHLPLNLHVEVLLPHFREQEEVN